MTAPSSIVPHPMVSIVVPAYNHGQWIAETLTSVLRQTFTDWEAIVVDDGSTDETAQVAAGFAPRIRYLRQENQGVSAARNRGLALGSGRYVAFLDDDDVWPPDKLELQVRALEAAPQVGMCYGAVCTMRGEWVGDCSKPTYRGDILLPLLRRRIRLGPSAVLIRRDVLDDVGGFDTRFSVSADYDLWLRIAARFPADYVDKPVLYYRITPGAWHRNLDVITTDPLRVLDKFFTEGPGQQRALSTERASAYGRAHYAIAGEAAHQGKWRVAVRHLVTAARHDPVLSVRRLATMPLRYAARLASHEAASKI